MFWIACAAGFLGLYVVAELAARWWIRFENRYTVCRPGFRLHAYPDRDVVPELEPLLRIEINSDGERGGEVRGRSPGLYRVLVAGGSAVEGLSLDQSSSWTAVVERILRTPENLRRLDAAAVHVGNIGRSGVTCRDLELIFARVLPQYRRLDAIILMVGGGDVASWIGAGAPEGEPAPALPVSELFACQPEGPFGWRPPRTALVELLKRWRQQLLRPIEVRHSAGKWMGIARAMRAAAAEMRTSTPDPTTMLDTFERCLVRVLQKAQAHADQILVVRQPWFEKDYTPEEVAHFWHGGVGHAWKKQSVSIYYALDVVNRLMALVDARATKVAEQLDVAHLNLQTIVEPSLNTFYDHLHYTPSGARQVGEAVAAALLRQRAPRGRRLEHRVAASCPRPESCRSA